MKKILTALVCVLVAITAQAQFQLANGDFENWETVEYTSTKVCEEPVRWSSFYDATGSMKSTGTSTTPQIYKDASTRPGSDGSFSCRITSRSVFGIVAQGNLTTGCVNMGSMTATDASGNYNYINEARSDQAMRFSGHPDAARFWVRFSGAKTGNCSILLTTKGYYQDPVYGDRNTATLVAQSVSGNRIVSNDEWTEYTVPFEWVGDQEPYYALVNVSTCSEPGAGAASDYLYIDDIEMVYNSEATAVYYDDIQILGEGTQPTSFHAEKMGEITVNGRAATSSWTFDYEAYELVVKVEGENVSEDPANVHTYRIPFTKPAAQLVSAVQDGVNLLEGASGVAYHAERCELTFNDDVLSHSEVFDKETCCLTILMTDRITSEVVEHVIQFHKPEPALLSAQWKGRDIALKGFSTGDIYVEENLVLVGNEDATLERQFDTESLLLTVTAKAEEGYEELDKVYNFQFGLGEMDDPRNEVILPSMLTAGGKYYIFNKESGLLLKDNDHTGKQLVEWTIGMDNTIKSESDKYVGVVIEPDGRSFGHYGSANPKSVTSTTSSTDAMIMDIAGDISGYTFSATKTWNYGVFNTNEATYTAYFGANGTDLIYATSAQDNKFMWQLYDVESYKNRAMRIELYDELVRAQQVGLDIVAYRQTLDAVRDNTEAVQALLFQVRQDEAQYVKSLYTEDCTELLGSTDLTNTEYWINDLQAKAWGQHWSGDGSRPYYEMQGDLWDQKGWSAGAEQTVTLPAGDYVLKAIARSGALTKAFINVDGKEVTFPANGDTGWGVDIYGDVNYSPEGTYCNEGIGRGWEYRYVTFSLSQRGNVNIKVGASTEDVHEWFSVCDISLMATPAPELKMMSFEYDGESYSPDETGQIDLSAEYYREDAVGGIVTGGYGKVSTVFDAYSSVLTITLSQEDEGYDYELEPVEYKVQFRMRQPELVKLTYAGVDVTDGEHIDAFYRASDLSYAGNADTESVQVVFDRETWSVTVKAIGYEREKLYVLYFKDASQVSTQYTEPISIEVNGELLTPDEITVYIINHEDGSYEFELQNFILNDGGSLTPIGTINLPDIDMMLSVKGVNCFTTQQTIQIAPGNLDGIETSDWLGIWLGPLPVDLTEGYIYGDHIYARLVIDAQDALEQTIVVTVGDISNIPDDPTVIKTIESLNENTDSLSDGKYFIGGRVVVVKAGKRYNIGGAKL